MSGADAGADVYGDANLGPGVHRAQAPPIELAAASGRRQGGGTVGGAVGKGVADHRGGYGAGAGVLVADRENRRVPGAYRGRGDRLGYGEIIAGGHGDVIV